MYKMGDEDVLKLALEKVNRWFSESYRVTLEGLREAVILASGHSGEIDGPDTIER